MLVERLKIDNYNFNYCSLGNTQNQTVILLHGFLGDCYDFQASMLLLSRQFHCLAIDLPGHGKTQVDSNQKYYEIDGIARGVIDFIDALNLDKCILVGYSMGGRLALYLALYFPQYFSHIILESASPGLKTLAEREQRLKQDWQLAKQLEEVSLSAFVTQWYDRPLFASIKQTPDFDLMLQRRLQGNPRQLAQALRYLSTGWQPSLWEKLRSHTLPLLLIVGELDAKFVAINQEMTGICQTAKLEIIANCGHNVHVEDVKSFVQKIVNFLPYT